MSYPKSIDKSLAHNHLPVALILSIPLLAAIAGGLAVWVTATSETPLYGGAPVRYSVAAHFIFWCIGMTAGFFAGLFLVIVAMSHASVL